MTIEADDILASSLFDDDDDGDSGDKDTAPGNES